MPGSLVFNQIQRLWILKLYSLPRNIPTVDRSRGMGTMENSKPTLHYLQNSGSQQSLWLLEELGIEYDLVLHIRETGRAPAALKDTHPLGKAPQLVTSSGRVIAERSAIAFYLIETYDSEGRFKVPSPELDPDWNSNDNDKFREEQLFSLALTALNQFITMDITFGVFANHAPFLVRQLMQGLKWGFGKLYLDAEIDNCFKVLDAELEGREYFNGTKSPTRLDFVMQWYVDSAVQGVRLDLSLYPRVKEWFERCISRDAWKRAVKKGNGYDLEFWKMKMR
ncbi:hypothetical protein F4818DRAFT_410496 [Hypoxylon cercidicola]|nr:hypothetical protein F4818DRAFT_410496 [Hypoxylon cercidicola]